MERMWKISFSTSDISPGNHRLHYLNVKQTYQLPNLFTGIFATPLKYVI